MGVKRQRRIRLQNNNREEENQITQPQYTLRIEIRINKQSGFSVSKQAFTKKRLVIRLNGHGSIKNIQI